MSGRAKTGDGQPRSNKRRATEGYFVRLLPAQKAEIELKASVVGLKPTAYLRQTGLAYRPVTSARVNQTALAQLARLTFQVNKIGVNVNQIARHCNGTGEVLAEEQLKQLQDFLTEVASDAANLIRKLGAVEQGEPDDS
jgi:hypothetical protein